MSQPKRISLTRLKTGDELEVNRWYERYESRVYRFIRQRISNEADVQDIAQSVFINSLKQLPLFRGESSIWSWMCGIARHEVADYYRKRYAKRIIKTVPFFDQLLGISDGSEPLEALTLSETTEIVHQVLASMKQSSARILRLKYFEKRAVQEIAHLLKRSPKSVESELYRARREFKALWNQG